MVGDVGVGSHKALICIGADLLRGAALQGVEVGARHGDAAKHGGVELLRQCQRQTLDQLVIQGRHIAAELVGEGHDDGQRVGLHDLGGQRAALDGLLVGLADPCGLRVAGDDRNGHAQARQLDGAGQRHDGGALLRFLQDLAGHLTGQGDGGSAVDISCHRKNSFAVTWSPARTSQQTAGGWSRWACCGLRRRPGRWGSPAVQT